jgi:hypothetical protein
MNTAEFQSQIERLLERNAWRNKFDQSFNDVLWENLKSYSAGPLKKAVDELLGQHNCPTVSDILFLTRKHNYGTRSDYIMQPNDCEWCDGFGVVMMSKNDRVSPFQCQKCPNGEKIKEHTSKWSDGSIATVGQGLHVGFEPIDLTLRNKIVSSFKEKKAQKKSSEQMGYWYNG